VAGGTLTETEDTPDDLESLRALIAAANAAEVTV